MVSESEIKQIKAHMKLVSTPASVKAVRTSDVRSEKIQLFCKQIADLEIDITCIEAESDTDGAPSIELAPNIHFSGVPSEKELAPFLTMLTAADEAHRPPADIEERINAVTMPAVLDLYVAPFCPHCPKLVDQLFPLAWANPDIKLHIIDAVMFDDLTRKAAIKSVPTLIIDDLFRSSGQIDLEEVLAFLLNRSPASLGEAALESMLKEGNAPKLSKMMAAENVVFPAFLKVLAHPKWPVRLGAMVALEDLAELNPELAFKVVDMLWAEFGQVPDQIRGDILYIIGEIGGPGSFERITSIKSGKHAPEVCEAAIDALQALANREKAKK